MSKHRNRVAACTIAGVMGCSAAWSADPAYRIVRSMRGPDLRWDYLSVDAGARRLYIGQVGGVSGVDLVTGKITERLTRSKYIHGVIPVGTVGQAIAAEGGTDHLTLFDGGTGAASAVITVGREPDSLVVEPKSGMVLAMNEGSRTASVVDLGKRATVATIALEGMPEFAAADGTGLVYDNIADHNEVAVIDPVAGKVTRRIAMPGCEEPTGLAYDHASGLLISACSNGIVKAIQATSGREVASLHVGEGPDAVILDEKRRRVFIPSGDAGTLSVISLAGAVPSVIQTIDTKKGVRTGAVDPVTGKVYLASADFIPGDTSAGGRPAVKPGTFQLIIVSPN